MAFFQSTFPQSDFGSLFRLLDDYDTHRSNQGTSNGGRQALRTFQPRFDVHEEGQVYHLNGEVPGINQEDIDITFTDPQTMVIKGRVERTYDNSSPAADEAKGQQPTVEEGDDETTNSEKAVTKTEDSKAKQVSANPKTRFWVKERSIGEFSRTFSFPVLVEQDGVKASLKNGILNVVVPKAQPAAARKIVIN